MISIRVLPTAISCLLLLSLTACDKSRTEQNLILGGILEALKPPGHDDDAGGVVATQMPDTFGTFNGQRYRIERTQYSEDGTPTYQEWRVETPSGMRDCPTPTAAGCVKAIEDAAGTTGYVPRQEDDKM